MDPGFAAYRRGGGDGDVPVAAGGRFAPGMAGCGQPEGFSAAEKLHGAGRQLIGAVRGQVAPGLAMVTESLEADFLQGLLSLLMVSVLTIPVSLILGFLLYKPLYSGPLVRGALYCSLNLVR